MKSKKMSICVLMILAAAAAFSQNVRIKVASIVPSRSNWDIEQHNMAQNFSRITNGAVTLQFMGATAMGGEDGVIQKLNAVRPGQIPPINGAIFTSLGLSELAPESSTLTLCVPFMFRNQGEVNAVLKEFSADMQKPVMDKGYEVLGWFCVGWAYFYTKKPARTPEALKTQRLCVGSFTAPALTNAFKAAGFLTIDVPAEKLLQSMKSPSGVEGLYTLPMYAYAAQYTKNLPYILDVPLCPILAAFIVSKDTWAKVPDKFKEPLIQTVQDSGRKFENDLVKSDADYLDRSEKAGATLVKLTPAEYAVFEKSFREDSKKMYEAKDPVVNKDLYDRITVFLKKQRGE